MRDSGASPSYSEKSHRVEKGEKDHGGDAREQE